MKERDNAGLVAFRIDEVDTFIAADRDDLAAVIQEHHGDPWDAMTGTSLSDAEVVMLDPAKKLLIKGDPYDPDDESETLTVAKWIEREGRGFLCSTEW